MVNRKINKDKVITFIFIIIGISIIFILGIKVYLDFFKDKEVNNELKRLDLYGYTLDKTDTELYKEYFYELESVLNSKEIDYNEYAELLSKLYIIDFYTLNNKISSTDIGSLEFVHPDVESNFKLKAKDTLYKDIKVNYDGKREQELPEVKSITLSDKINDLYVYDNTEYESYKIKCTWTYVKDLGYENESNLIIIKDGTKLYIVESD